MGRRNKTADLAVLELVSPEQQAGLEDKLEGADLVAMPIVLS